MQRLAALRASEDLAEQSITARPLVAIGEAYFAMGDHDKALDLMKQGIAGLDRDDAPFAQLQLGVAQYTSGRIAEARATWNTIRPGVGAHDVAQAWLALTAD